MESKVKINQCDHKPLMTLPNVGAKLSMSLIYHRERHGNVTEEILRKIPYLRVTPELLDRIDFDEHNFGDDNDRALYQDECDNIMMEMQQEEERADEEMRVREESEQVEGDKVLTERDKENS